LAAIDASDTPRQAELPLTQEHALIRPADEYADLFTRCADAQPIAPCINPSTHHDHE